MLSISDPKPAEHVPTADPVRSGRQFTIGGVAFHLGAQAILIVWAILVIFPFVWMITTSFKTDMQILTDPFGWPDALRWENFERAWTTARIGRYVVNTLIVMSMSLTGTLLVSALAAYALTRFQFRGNRFIFLLFTAGLMFPMFLGLVPLYFLMQDLNLLNTYYGLALVYIAYSLPFTIFFLAGFFHLSAWRGRRGISCGWWWPVPNVLPDHAAYGQAGPDRDGHLQLSGAVEPVPAPACAYALGESIYAQSGVELHGDSAGVRQRLQRTFRCHDHYHGADTCCVHPLPASS